MEKPEEKLKKANRKIAELNRALSSLTEQEKELELTRQRFIALTESSTDAIVGCTRAGTVINFWDRAAASLFGYSSEEIIGKPLNRIIPEQLRRAHKEGVDRFIESKQGKYLGKVVESKGLKKDGREFPIEFSYGYWESEGQVHITAIIRDITERKDLEKTIKHQALHDALTDLPNRALFNDRLMVKLTEAGRYGERFALLFLDLDYFKQVNDTLGHKIGDKLLVVIASKLRGLLRKSETIARQGGDEFLILTPKAADDRDLTVPAKRILDAISEPLFISGNKINISASIGIAIYPHDGTDADTLITNADSAMYLAKQQGRNRYRLYKNISREEKQTLEQQMRRIA